MTDLPLTTGENEVLVSGDAAVEDKESGTEKAVLILWPAECSSSELLLLLELLTSTVRWRGDMMCMFAGRSSVLLAFTSKAGFNFLGDCDGS